MAKGIERKRQRQQNVAELAQLSSVVATMSSAWLPTKPPSSVPARIAGTGIAALAATSTSRGEQSATGCVAVPLNGVQ